MLYRFKSRATPDLIMLEPHGRRILEIIGKAVDEPRGILAASEMPAAIAALEAAMAEDDARRRRAGAADPDEDDTATPGDAVGLRQRAAPFIETLRRCKAEDRELVWGV